MAKNSFKFLMSLTIFSTVCFENVQAQYSNFYNVYSQTNSRVDTNLKANINHNVSGTVVTNSTINTIDYGALALANAQREKNLIEKQKFTDENQRKILAEIIDDPLKAYDYGQIQGFNSKDRKVLDKKTMQQFEDASGLKSFSYSGVFPAYFFNMLNWLNWQNVSKDGVTTELFFYLPVYNKQNVKVDYEEIFEKDTLLIKGKEIESTDDNGKPVKFFLHNNDFNKATVFGGKGYKQTLIWEDKYEIGITDHYMVFGNNNVGNGVEVRVKVRYYGNKKEFTFEQIEGRQYYLKPLIEKIISTAKLQDVVLLKK